MKSQRQLQIGETLKRIMSEIFLRDDILTVPGSYITLTEVDVSPDAKNAKIFIDIFGNDAIHGKIIAKLNEAAPHFRYQLAKKITLRVVPEIIFELDKRQKNVASVEAILDQENKRYASLSESPAKKKPARKSINSAARKKK